jgi:hypothetical protein
LFLMEGWVVVVLDVCGGQQDPLCADLLEESASTSPQSVAITEAKKQSSAQSARRR